MTKFACLLLAAIFCAGCATKGTGFHRDIIADHFFSEKVQVTEKEIEEALKLKPQLRFPIKIAVFLDAETYNPHQVHDMFMGPRDWRWTVEDKAVMDSWTQKLKDEGVDAEIFVVSDLVREGKDRKSMRLAAAKHGANAVLQVQGITQIDTYYSHAAYFNLLIVPGFFVPSMHRDSYITLQGALWDVGNEFLYATAEAEGEVKEFTPVFVTRDNSKVLDEAKKKALKQFGVEIIKHIKGLKESAAKDKS